MTRGTFCPTPFKLHGAMSDGSGNSWRTSTAERLPDTAMTPAIPSITLQLAPSARVTEDMRRVVLKAVEDAGLEFSGWVPLQGQANIAKRPRVAQPSLSLIFSWSRVQAAEQFTTELGLRVGNALAGIRGLVPALPAGIYVEVD